MLEQLTPAKPEKGEKSGIKTLDSFAASQSESESVSSETSDISKIENAFKNLLGYQLKKGHNWQLGLTGTTMAPKKDKHKETASLPKPTQSQQRLGLKASILLCLRDARFTEFSDSTLGVIESSLCNGPVHFDCYPDFTGNSYHLI
ncbi:hypothetical protein L3X38_011830 [Prunus dulcis]|uniref:Uncharacterized protein n=1 Tax=Prunus dulcis TaxID=3755 RepID=A0AAD4WJS9_PRUDU|nr:hypothetical protein L3X38_011830 [Prunus dulcis]